MSLLMFLHEADRIVVTDTRATAPDGTPSFFKAAQHTPVTLTAITEELTAEFGPFDDPCQLDAVALAGRHRKPVLVGEAKWAKKVNGSSLLGGLRRKLYDSKLADPDTISFVVCAREVVERSTGTTVVTAADIFG